MSDDAKVWRWVGEDGAEKTVDEHELVSELTAELLPNYTLVWRKGWAEWLPAMQVAELAWSLPPGKADTPAKPREKPGAESPPAPPLYRYPVLKRRAQNLRPDVRVSRPVPRPPAKAPAAAPSANTAPQPVPTKRASKPPPAPSQRVVKPPPAPSQRPSTPLPPGAAAPAEPKLRDVPIPPGAQRPALSKPPPPPSLLKRAPQPTVKKPEGLQLPPPAPLVPIGESGPAKKRSAALPARGSSILSAEHDTIEQPPLPPEEEEVEEDIDSLTVKDEERRLYSEAFDEEPTNVTAATRMLGSEPVYVAPHAPPAPESVRPPPPEEAREEAPPPEAASEGAAPEGSSAVSPSADPSPSFDEEMLKFPAPPPPPADLQKFARVPGQRSFSPVQIAAAAGALLVVVGLGLWLFGGSEEPTVEQRGAAATSSIASPAGPGATLARSERRSDASKSVVCTVKTPAIKLADHAEPSVPPILATIPSSKRIAAGFAQSRTEALGITLDPVTLDRDQVFRRKARTGEVVSVAPLTASGKLRFDLVRTKDDVAPAALVDQQPPFVIGQTKEGIARRTLPKGTTEVVFPGNEDQITAPRIATVPAVGHAIAYRRGGLEGTVVTGWLTPTGARMTDIGAVTTTKKSVGTPTIASNGSGILVAFAARGTDEQNWQLALAHSKHTKNPTNAMLFETPKGGPGQNLISPALAGIGNDRFLLQWTEGSSGNRSVRLQVLDSSLKPDGPPVNLSPDAMNAGGGSIWVSDTRAISLFFVQHGDDHELWGSALECSH